MRLLTVIRAMLSMRLLAAIVVLLVPAAASAEPADVQTAWRLLDYVAVDYGGAVEAGRIKSKSEYSEMNEFAASVSTRLLSLPAKPERQSLIQGAASLQALIGRKGSAEQSLPSRMGSQPICCAPIRCRLRPTRCRISHRDLPYSSRPVPLVTA